MKKFKPRHLIMVIVALLLAVATVFFSVGKNDSSDKGEKIDTGTAVQMINDGKVKKAVVSEATILNGTGSLELTDTDGKKYTSTYSSGLSQSINTKLLDKGVELETKAPDSRNSAIDGLIGMLPMLLMIGLVVILAKRQGMFKSKKFDAGLEGGDIPDVKFEDIAGADEAVAEVKEMIELLNGGERFIAMGAKPPKGALLVGPPGTGKTLIAKAAAGESGLPFYSTSGSDFVEVFAGLGPRRVRRMFEKARKTGGIIFIDEIDAVGQKRGSTGQGGDTQERENIIAAFLTEMDGFSPRDNVLVLAATNRAETIDEALLRPGRLERQIHVPLPDIKGREGILKVHIKGKNIGEGVDLHSVAKQTAGMSGAELAFVINEACMNAVRREHESVTSKDIYDAINTVAMGRSRDSAYMNKEDRELTAYHEAGHATVALLASRDAKVSIRPNFITIVPRGQAGGLTRMNNEETHYMRKSTARNFLSAAMGGRAAEIAVYGEDHFTSGAHGDLCSATGLATNMALKFGMSDEGRLIAMEDREIQMSQGKHDHLIQGEMEDALKRAKAYLASAEGKMLMEAIALELLDKESLHEEDINEIELQTLGTSYALPKEKVTVEVLDKDDVDEVASINV